MCSTGQTIVTPKVAPLSALCRRQHCKQQQQQQQQQLRAERTLDATNSLQMRPPSAPPVKILLLSVVRAMFSRSLRNCSALSTLLNAADSSSALATASASRKPATWHSTAQHVTQQGHDRQQAPNKLSLCSSCAACCCNHAVIGLSQVWTLASMCQAAACTKQHQQCVWLHLWYAALWPALVAQRVQIHGHSAVPRQTRHFTCGEILHHQHLRPVPQPP
jgi:hypothetical protein